MNKDLIVYSGVSAAIIACFGVCTWTLTRQAQTLVERMDVMDRRLSAMQEADASRYMCAAPERPKWCEAPIVAPPEASTGHFVPDDPQPAAPGGSDR